MPANSPPARRSPSELPDPVLPARPTPPRSLGEALAAWLTWFGLGRLVLTALSVGVVAVGAVWLLRAPTPDTVTALPVAGGAGGAPSTLPSTLPAPTAPATTDPAVTTPQPIVVHVAGAVNHPGVFTLPPGSRANAAVEAAGGPAQDAELDGLNLATPLTDGQRVYVPAVGEVDPAVVEELAVAPPPGGESAAGEERPGPIDLNRATAVELEQLPGVGPATAAAIIDDRERHGPYATVDDLDRVPGIGPAKVDAIRDLVTV
jgi:competence protein ComEA